MQNSFSCPDSTVLLTPVNPRYGYTPAYVAAEAGNTTVLQQLIEASADPFCADDDGVTPLDRAASCGHASTVRLLVAADVKQNGLDAVLDTGKLVAGALTHYVREALKQRQLSFQVEADKAADVAKEEAAAAAAEAEADGEAEAAELEGTENLMARVIALEAKWFPACQG